MKRNKPYSLAVILIMVSMLVGCSVANVVVHPYEKITLTSSKKLNPDINDRPSPIQVKVLHLSSRATFDNLDFEQLFFNADTLLSDELIFEESYTLQPSQVLEKKLPIDKGTQFIAVIAAYRNIDDATWRHITPINDSNYYKHAYEIGENAIVKTSRSSKRKTFNTAKIKDRAGSAKDKAANAKEAHENINGTVEKAKKISDKI